MRGYEIYKLLSYGYFTWVGNEPDKATALKRLRALNRKGDRSRHIAVRKALLSLRLTCRKSSPLLTEPEVTAA